MTSGAEVSLREVSGADVEVFFGFQKEPEGVAMAAVPVRNRDAHFVHWTRIRADGSNVVRTILFGDSVAGNVVSWEAGDRRLIGYWIGRDYWGKGIATKALALFIGELAQRPLFAFVATGNVGSIRVLEKCGFVVSPDSEPIVGDDGVEELLYELPA